MLLAKYISKCLLLYPTEERKPSKNAMSGEKITANYLFNYKLQCLPIAPPKKNQHFFKQSCILHSGMEHPLFTIQSLSEEYNQEYSHWF